MPSTARLLCIDPAVVNVLWPLARELIKRAFDRTGLSDFADTEKEVLSGLQLLWLAWNGETIEAAVTTQLIRVSMRKICVITACGGNDRARWLPLLAGIETYAREEGCTGMRIYGRKGWQRALNGYRARHVVLTKELS